MLAKAAICLADGSFIIDTVEIGDPGPGEVLVQIKASGVCHTDHKMLHLSPVRIMGHEGAGIVLKTGDGVRHVSPGDPVVLNWAMPCGNCPACRAGLRNVCEDKPSIPPGRFKYKGNDIATAFGLGTMSTHTVVPAAAALKMTADIPFTSACILGCCVMTGYGSVVNVAKVDAGSSVAVIGAGAVGLCTIEGARIAGASTIIAIDINPKKLDFAKRFGATHTILADKADEGLLRAAAEVKSLTAGRGADYAFESTSQPSLCCSPLAMVRNGGTAVQISGTEQKVPIDMELFEWDKVYINPLYGKCVPERDFPKLMRHYQRNELHLDDLVTGVYTLDDLATAFADMLQGKNAKAVLVMD